jgi:hypothetical protein
VTLSSSTPPSPHQSSRQESGLGEVLHLLIVHVPACNEATPRTYSCWVQTAGSELVETVLITFKDSEGNDIQLYEAPKN